MLHSWITRCFFFALLYLSVVVFWVWLWFVTRQCDSKSDMFAGCSVVHLRTGVRSASCRPWGRRSFRSTSFLPSILFFFLSGFWVHVHIISSVFFFWRWVVTVVSVPSGLTHVLTVLSCQNCSETTNYEVLKNLEGFSLAFAPFHN